MRDSVPIERDITAFVMYCVKGESVMIIDYHNNKSIICIYNIIDYDNRLIVPALIDSRVVKVLHRVCVQYTEHMLSFLTNIAIFHPPTF